MKLKKIDVQLENEISAVKTVLDVSLLIIKNSKSDEKEKEKLIEVLNSVYSTYIARLIGKQAIEIVVRRQPEHIRRIFGIAVPEIIRDIEQLLKEKEII